jgi:uncharacterized radical SAM superfamily Fe-S cluster-containing enzyme
MRRREDSEEIVLLCRVCPQHGVFEEVVWRGEPALAQWHRPKSPASNLSRQTAAGKGCPRDCGRCPGHAQHACTVLLEITQSCNLRCPVCFADAGNGDPRHVPLDLLLEQLAWIREQAGPVVLQLSGGEPMLHPRLPELVEAACRLFPAVQLNTNGIALAGETGKGAAFAESLARTGLSWVFLQFDGTKDEIFTALRGRPLLRQKLQAVANCKAAGLPVVLVPTVVRGVNDQDLGALLRLALSLAPAVRGVHLQPMTRSGRNAFADDGATLTLPEVLAELCVQSGGMVKKEHAAPPGCEHERCSFHCRYFLTRKGELVPLRESSACCGPVAGTADFPSGHEADAAGRESLGRTCCPMPPRSSCCAASGDREDVERAVDVILRSWRGDAGSTADCECAGLNDFDRFIAEARAQSFSLTCMAFQDARTVDLERLRGCCVHVFSPPARLIPFCSYNLTSTEGVPLYRKKRV